jgi:Ca2+-binding RTX toxin-like protein
MTVYNVTNDAQLQAALAAQQNGDVINLSAGTFTTNVVISADITINGAKAGQAGDSSSRGFGESVLNGGVQINGDGVTIDGVQVVAGGVGANNHGAVEVAGDNATLTNIYFLGDASNANENIADDWAMSVYAGVAGFSLTDNAVRGWAVGAYVANGATGEASDNLFDQNGNGINTESVLFNITQNHFQHALGGGDITVIAFGLNDDASDFVADDNTFQRDDGLRSIAILAQTAGSHTIGTDFADYFDAFYGAAGDYAFSGGLGADRAFGASGNDTLLGETGNDTLYGSDGMDSLLGGVGDDTLSGEADDDVLEGGSGSNLLDGGDGSDTASYANAEAGVTVNLALAALQPTGAGSDQFVSIENLSGSAFADTLSGDNDANVIDGGAGADTLNGNAGDDDLRGGDDGDYLNGGNGADSAYGGSGDDVIDGKVGDDHLDGQIGRDLLNGGTGADSLLGGENFDTLFGGAGDDYLQGEGGNDTLLGGDGFDTLDGGDGSDTASFQDASEGVYISLYSLPKSAPDGIRYGDVLYNIENLQGSRFNDNLQGDNAANILSGDLGQDDLYGNDGADTLLGGQKHDQLFGGDGKDSLDGGRGEDWLDGGADDDVLTGGDKADTFLFLLNHDDDTITDFDAGSGKNHDVVAYDFEVFSDFADVMDHAIQLGSDVVILEDNGDTLRLNDVLLSELTTDNFAFNYYAD